MSPRNDPVSPAMARSRDPEKGDRSKEEMAEAADALTLVDGKGGAGGGKQSTRLGCKVGGWIGNRTATGWNLSWAVLSCGFNVEPESMVNLAFVKNDSYEKGPDSVVVHVYVKEICRDTSRVLFREQDFTLIFQTRWVGWQETGQTVHFRQDIVSHAFLPTLPPALPLLCFCRDGNFLRLHPGCGPHTIFRWQVKLRWVVPGPSTMPVPPWALSPWPI